MESQSVSECRSSALRIRGIGVIAGVILALEETRQAARRDEVDHGGGDSRGEEPRSPLVQLPALHSIDEVSIEPDRLPTPRTRLSSDIRDAEDADHVLLALGFHEPSVDARHSRSHALTEADAAAVTDHERKGLAHRWRRCLGNGHTPVTSGEDRQPEDSEPPASVLHGYQNPYVPRAAALLPPLPPSGYDARPGYLALMSW